MSHQRRVSSTRSAISSGRRLRPCLEILEDRITPTTFIPTTFADDGSANSLRGAITQANNDTGTTIDTIQLSAGKYTLSIANSSGKHETANAQGDVNLDDSKHSLVIQGTTDAKGTPTTIIQQAVLDRVFDIGKAGSSGVTVTFKDLVIRDGRAQDDGSVGAAAGSTDSKGGGILDAGGNVILSNVVLVNNSANAGTGFSAYGGGIYAEKGGSLTTQSSSISANAAFGGVASTSSDSGGSALGGGVYTSCPTTITRSTLSGNVAIGGNSNNNKEGDIGGDAAGGGVYALGTLSITDSTLSDNRLTGGAGDRFVGGSADGGGIVARGTTTITNSVLSANIVTGGSSSSGIGGAARGGGVDAEGKVTISTSTLSGNRLIGSNTNLSSNVDDGGDGGGDAEGGGIFVGDRGTATISASTLSNNILTGGNGSINNSSAIIRNNVGGHAEGGSVFAEFFSTVSISASTLSGNTLIGGKGEFVSGKVTGSIGGDAAGGGVYGTIATVTIAASTLSGNALTGGNASGGIADPGTAKGGGAYFVGGGTYNLVNSTIADNQATGGLGIPKVPSASGGGLFFKDSATTATLTNVTVADNKAILPPSSSGVTLAGGIDNDQAAVTLVNTLVALNSAVVNIDYTGIVLDNSGHNLIGNASGSIGFSAAHGDLVGSNDNPINPHLGPLANNGGPTLTMALLPGSPAINAGDNSARSVTGPFDQRGQGFTRVANGTIDIGAFEVQPPPSPPPPSPKPPPTLHTPPLLAFFDALLGGVETVNGNGTETVIDSIFGIPLLVSLYDSAGNLVSVTLFGINITFLFA